MVSPDPKSIVTQPTPTLGGGRPAAVVAAVALSLMGLQFLQPLPLWLRAASVVVLALCVGLSAWTYRQRGHWPLGSEFVLSLSVLMGGLAFDLRAGGAWIAATTLTLAATQSLARRQRIVVYGTGFLCAGLALLFVVLPHLNFTLMGAEAVVTSPLSWAGIAALAAGPFLGEYLSTPAPEFGADPERIDALELQVETLRISSRTKTRFLATTSHEIRTPLNGILGLSALLAEEDLDPGPAGRVQVILDSAESLLRILNDVVDMAKIEANELEIAEAPFDLGELVDGVVATAGVVALKKGLELIPEIAPTVHRKRIGDAGRIRQIVLNLVHNAIKFTPTGSITIGVDSAGEEEVYLRVRDTGVGIPGDQLGKMFETFAQVSAQELGNEGGAGLGLAIVRELADRMGGQLDVQSAQGRGTEFTCTLRLAKHGQDSEPPALKGQLFVVATNALATRELLCSTLYGWGAVVHVLDPMQLALDEPRRSARVIVDAGTPLAKGTPAVQRIILGEAANKDDVAIALPVTLGELKAKLERRSADRPAAPKAAPSLKGITVLVADDNEVNRLVAVAALERAGARTRVAEDGQQALELVRSEHIDLVLMDLEMPKMDGLEATHELRRIGSKQPIIGLTAHAGAEQRQRCLDGGMDDHMSKPYRPEDLVKRVRAMARGKSTT